METVEDRNRRLNAYAKEKVVDKLKANVKEQMKKNEEKPFPGSEEDLRMIRYLMDCAGNRIKMVSKTLKGK